MFRIDRILIAAGFAALAAAAAAQAAYVRGVPYFNQLQNQLNPGGTCQNTCAAMLLAYYGAQQISPDDITARWGSEKAQTVQGWAEVFNTEAAERGLAVRDQGVSDGRLAAVYRHLDRGLPAVVHGRFSQSGHLIVLLGYDEDYFYAHDPAGNGPALGGVDPEAGRHLRYPRDYVERAIADLATGYVRFHAITPLSTPVDIRWVHVWPDSVVAGAAVDLDLMLRVSGEQAATAELLADLTALNGSASVPLQRVDGNLRSVRAALSTAGIGAGRYRLRVVATGDDGDPLATAEHDFVVTPPATATLIDGDAFTAAASWTGVGASVEPQAADPAGGGHAVAIDAEPFDTGFDPPRLFVAACSLPEPLSMVGFRALELLVHPAAAQPINGGLLALFINDDLRTLVPLAAGGSGLVDMEEHQWQPVTLDLRDLAFIEEPIRSIHVAGEVEGRFYVDDLRLLPADPCPLEAEWRQPPVAELVAGQPGTVSGALRLARQDPQGAAPSVLVDLSAMGGGRLQRAPDGDGEVRFAETVQPGSANGLRRVTVLIEQQSGGRTHRLELACDVPVLPAGDLLVYGDAMAAGWDVSASANASVELASGDAAYAGQKSMALQTRGFVVDLLAAAPLDSVGYAAVRFAVLPASVTSGRAEPAFSVLLNQDGRTAVRLVGAAAGAGPLDMARPEWQVVEVPIAAFGEFGGRIESVRLLGNLEGALYLDQVQLIARTPAPPPTAVTDAAAATPLQAALAPSYPNPFNQSTSLVFRLARPQRVELAVYDVLGQRVATVVDAWHEAGEHRLRWDARDSYGVPLATGVYVVRLRTPYLSAQHKALLLR